MNKADIVDKVHSVLGSTKADAERAVETVIDSIVSGLKSGNEVSIAGLGIFATKARPARQGCNPAPARRFTSTPPAPRSSAPQRRSRTQLGKGFVLKTRGAGGAAVFRLSFLQQGLVLINKNAPKEAFQPISSFSK